MELVRNRSFILTTGDSKQSRLRLPKNGVPQGSVLAPLLFNIYTYYLPSMISRKFAHADDLALLQSSENLGGTLSQDMCTLSSHLQTWGLKLSHTKTLTAHSRTKFVTSSNFPRGLSVFRTLPQSNYSPSSSCKLLFSTFKAKI